MLLAAGAVFSCWNLAPGSLAAAELDPIASLRPGEWYEVPHSHLQDVAPKEADFPWLRGNVGAVIAAWAGGAFDTQRDRLYIGPGGGHGGYNGNEVYAFDLHDLKWHRLNNPDPVIPGTEYTDAEKAPFAMHTYDGVEYLPPPVDRYVVIGGWGTERTYALNPDRPDRWEVYPFHNTGRTGDLCAYDPVGGRLWLSTPTTAGKLSQWDPLEHHWTLRRADSPEASYYETADVDWRRRLLVACGRGKLKTWKLTDIPGRIDFQLLPTSGDTAVMERASPGFCYVPPLDRFVAWASGADVYTLDLDARRWTRHPPAASNRVTPGPPDQWGTFGRFRYVPSRNIFILYNAVNQNVFLYRLTADRPNVITGVEARPLRKSLEAEIAAPAALDVEAIYADGTRRDVTGAASYFSLDPDTARVDLHGGTIHPLAPGTARIRAVYSDPAFKRGFASVVELPVLPLRGDVRTQSLSASYEQVTIVAGDRYQLQAVGRMRRGVDEFSRDVTAAANWSSDATQLASVDKGLILAHRPGGPVTARAEYQGRACTTDVTVVAAPLIQRIAFQVKDTIDRPGWKADNGQPYSDARGYGWLNVEGLATRDDRDRARTQLMKHFVTANNRSFKIQVPRGFYQVRVAMGDADYGAAPFADFVALDAKVLLYYEGRNNDVATRVVQAGNQGLVFNVNGPINYLIVAPVGIDLEKYAQDEDAPTK